ncbi:ABC transporter ATP-binding protein [Lacrimispora sp.]|uniref:ABC transporter ATP-binding protein n=1 Tax=Lacrimispora sp. TaxID=2719234 RepID=UPI0028984027|nr:ABC transporter ATP-binding protein [Lacrimispora sp.]
MKELLKMEHITKHFGEVYANRDINLSVQEGEVHTLLGENGAGKSTLMNILIGLYQPTGGEIYLRGKKVKIESPKAAVRLGIGMVHQHFMLVEAMTVFENIILGSKKDSSIFIDKELLKKDILELAGKYGLDVELDKTVTEISVGAQQRVEILKALYRGAEILILDEPTAVLTDMEVEGLFAIIRKLTGENKSVIFISHKMREVLAISDRITILRAGETVTTLDKDKTDGIQLANLMIGREMVPSNYRKVTVPGAFVLDLEHVDYQKMHKHSGLNDVSLTVKKGEVLGIAGVDGNGQSQLAQLAAGIISPDAGTVSLKADRISKFVPNGFILSHVSHVPEDRNKMGLVGNMTVRENLVLKATEEKRFSYGRGALLKSKSITAFALSMQKKNDIRCASIEQEVRNLSGGNQQKIILARELENDPELLVAVHPTRGLDIGAARYVHDTMIAARDKGCGILLISADFDEILNLSDRIIVMFEGQVMGIYSGDNPPIEEISLAMAGKGN